MNTDQPFSYFVLGYDYQIGASPIGEWVRYEDHAALQAKVTKLESDIRCMVEKAADQKLDGYRELAAKVAAAENSAEALRANLVTALNTPDERAVLEVCANCWDEDHIIRTIMKWREDRASK